MSTMFAIYLWLMQLLGLGVHPGLVDGHTASADLSQAATTASADDDRCPPTATRFISNGF